MTAASFSTKPTAPLMSFLETADDEGVPQYYEGGGGVVERSPPSSSGPPSTRPPSILSPSEHSHHAFMHHYASHAIKTTASGTGMADKDVVDAWRRRQTPEHEDEDDEATLQQQPATSLSDQFSGLLHISAGEGKDAKNRVHRFEDMSDAEIAQHHFRLAQQHLRAAQRLALAAVSAPPAAHSSTASSAPSSSLSSASATSSSSASRARHSAQQHFVADLVQRRERDPAATSWTASPVEAGWHGPAPGAGEYQQRREKQQQQQQQRSGDSCGSSTAPETLSPSSSSSVSGAAAVAPPPNASRPSAPPAFLPPPSLATPSHAHKAARPHAIRFDSTLSSSVSVRSAPLLDGDGGGASSATQSKKPLQHQRPVPPPRRATVGSAGSKAGAGGLLGMAVADPTPPLLHGHGTVAEHPHASSEDPRSQAVRIVRSISPSIYGDETDSVLNEQAVAAAATTHLVDDPSSQSPPLKVSYEVKEEENEEAEEEEAARGPDWDDDDDARSDFYGAESVVSHVTRATLPEYEDALAMSALPPPVPAIPSRFLAPLQTGAIGVDNLHKSATSVATTVDPPPFRTGVRGEDEQDFHGFRPRQTLANYPETTLHRTQQPAQSAIRPAHVHSPPFSNLQPHAYVLSPTGQPIPIYSSAAFSPAAAATAGSAAALSNVTATRANTLPVHAQPLRFEHSVPYSAPYVNSTVEVTYPNRKVSAATPALTSRPSTGSLSQLYHHAPPPSRPQSSWSDTSSGADRDNAETRSLAAGSTFSRTKNRISSSLRAARVPHVRFMSPDPTVLRAPRGGGSARQAPKTGVRRSASVTTPSSSSDSQRPLVIPEQDDDEDHKRQRAMQMSLGMLI